MTASTDSSTPPATPSAPGTEGPAPVLRVRGLTKRYGTATVLDGVDLDLRSGRVYGLIGRNGAGKTTLMRLVAGLGMPSAGTVELFGSSGAAVRAQYRRLGVLIEEPGLHHHLTARQNLDLHRVLRGVADRSICDELLELVGLGHVGHKRVRSFSLGMRQRLGIGVALVASPQLVILDEPVNGLDPSGVAQVRALIRSLAEDRGMTVLLSSHNLPELYQTASDYIIIDAGRIMQQLTHDELEQRTRTALRIRVADPSRVPPVLEQAFGAVPLRILPDASVQVLDPGLDPEQVLRALVARDVYPSSFALEGQSLEEYFFSAVGGAT